MELERHTPLYFEAALMSGLPLTVQVSEGCSVSLDYAFGNEIPAIHGLIRDCARRGDNVGIEEYLDREAWETKMASISWIFTIKDPQSKALEGGLLIAPMQQGRSLTPGNAGVYLYLSEGLGDKGGFSPLMQTAEKICGDLKLRYFACVCSVFTCLHGRVRALRDLGYTTAAIIPLSGEVKGHRGLVENGIMVKEFGPRQEPYTRQQLIEMIDTNELVGGEEYFQDLEVPMVKSLPKEYISRKGIPLIIRNVAADDYQWMFDLLRGAADSSDGYPMDSFPTLEVFKETLLSNSYSIIVELASSGKRTSFLNLSTAAVYSRGAQPIMCDCNLIADPEFKGLGIGNELYDLWFSIAKELGYKAVISDLIMTNARVMSLVRGRGFVTVGSLPRSCYMKGIGWTDTYIVYRSIVDETPFTQLQRERQIAFEQEQKLTTMSKI